MAKISCTHLNKSYGPDEVVQDFNLEVDDHEFVVFLGPSGCGKSTILRMIAGLEDISGGTLTIDGRVVNDLLPRERNVAMVFQNYALYPHMTVFENIAFGLRRMKVKKPEIERRVQEVAAILGLDPYLARKPTQLSGGQQQRVAIARAMIKTPQVFLFDEPLSNLDAKLRNHMRVEIARLHKKLKTTTVYVTHDQLEAMTLADRIVLLKGGVIEQVGTPAEIYERPRTLFVAGFIGTPNMNLIEVTIGEADGKWLLSTGKASVAVDKSRFDARPGAKAVLGIRPADLKPAGPGSIGSVLEGTVDLVEFLGNEVLADIALLGRVEGEKLVSALLPVPQCPPVGSAIRLAVDEQRIHLFDAESGLSLLREAVPDQRGVPLFRSAQAS
jgi:multiple sugar transport system ATP-binding protein